MLKDDAERTQMLSTIAELQEEVASLKQSLVEHQEMGEHSRSMYDTNDFGVYRLQIDPSQEYNAVVVLANDAIEDIVGCSDKMDFSTYFEHVHPDDRERLVRESNQECLQEDINFNTIFRINHPQKGVRWLNVRAWGALCHTSGACMYSNGLVFDITERKMAEAELEERVEARTAALEKACIAAEDANVAKSEFLTNMSHEIRTPINVMLGISQVMQETTLTPVQQQCLDLLTSSGLRLLDLISDIVDISKIESGTIVLENAPFDLSQNVMDIIRMLQVEADRKGLAFNFSIAPGIPPMVLGDAKRLRQIIINLLANAIKYTPEGEVSMIVSKKKEEDGLIHIDFDIKDTGLGIAEEDQKAIFERFRQVDSSASRLGQGSGLGLTIANSLAVMMGGGICLESQLGKGSTFMLSLPFALNEEMESRRAAPRPPTPLPHAYRNRVAPKAKRDPADMPALDVLIVEDDESNRMLMELFLEKTPMTLTFAVNGRDALTSVKDHRFDVIIMDMQMPLMDGYETTPLIRTHEKRMGWKPMKILSLTANSMIGERAKCLACGCDEYMTKPVRKQELFDMLASFCSG